MNPARLFRDGLDACSCTLAPDNGQELSPFIIRLWVL